MSVFIQLGVVFLEQGKASQALAYLDKALEFDPDHEQALLNSAILLQELGRVELRKVARERLLKLLQKDGKSQSKSLYIYNRRCMLYGAGLLVLSFTSRLGSHPSFILSMSIIRFKDEFKRKCPNYLTLNSKIYENMLIQR